MKNILNVKKVEQKEENVAEKRELKRGVNQGVERGVNYRRPSRPAKPSSGALYKR